jgi:hypothetical protein
MANARHARANANCIAKPFKKAAQPFDGRTRHVRRWWWTESFLFEQ